MAQLLPTCKCAKVIAILKALGAKHAAFMHELSARGIEHGWTKEDWLLHFMEEETLLFPRMLAKGQGALVRRLTAEHDFFRGELMQYGRIVSQDRMDRHAAVEDLAVLSVAA